MRAFLIIWMLLLSFVEGKAWAIPELRMVNGVVTLPEVTHNLFKITGEAEFLWDVQVTPEEFEEHKDQVQLVPFPSYWLNLSDFGAKPQGQATYRMTVELPESALGKPLGIWFPRSLGPATVWLNQNKVFAHDFGPDGSDFLNRSPGHNRIYLTPRETRLQFVIQTFNWHIHTGGFVDRFLIGPAEELRATNLKLMAFDFLVCGLLMFSAVYHLWLYTFRRKFLAYRELGLFFLLVDFRIFSTGSSHWLTELGWNEIFVYKVSLTTYYACIMVGVNLIRAIYPLDTPLLLVKVVRVVCSFALAGVIFLPLTFSYMMLRPMQLFTIFVIIPVMWSLFKAYWNRRQGSLVLLPTTGLLLSMATVEIYQSVKNIDQDFSLIAFGALLFSLGASVSQSLSFDRTFHMVERQTRGIAGLNRKLRKQAELLEHRIQETNEEMTTLLHNLPEGVLLIEEHEGRLRVGSYLSQSMKNILGSDRVTWDHVQDFLGTTNLDADQRAQLEATLGAMLGDDAISYELNADNLPRELQTMDEAKLQTFLCAWAPVILQGHIHSVLLVLVDVSSERSVSHHLEMEQQIFDRMVQLMATESDNFAIFMQEAQQIIKRLESTRPELVDSRQARILRELHTLKGLARSFGLLSLARTAHEMEDRLLRQPLSGLEPLFAVWQSHQDAFAMLGLARSHASSQEKEEDLLLVCGQQLLARPDPPSEIWHEAWQGYVQSLFVRVDALVGSLEEGLGSVAAQLGKPMPQIIMEGGAIGIRRSIQGKLLGGLNHILRNAIDHGLEGPEERRALNKTDRGLIMIRVHYHEKMVIEVYDDGRGLNLPRIRARALEKGLITEDQQLSDEAIAQFVFAPGFSTKKVVNDISGRGIGMDAVQSAIRQLGGQIRITWRGRKKEDGCREGMWCILLPRRYGFHEVDS
ncbi:Hpt domain-containing protein [Oligoflexus tunisiensis]|uniref:Hpt domain-containing protein n=1 Tax=Oligoflexus tunisiensis TaxID=708132 RepID=UPI000ADB2B46|nr:Hpt domain-containing protein [Oligoflexus tunisiensis]